MPWQCLDGTMVDCVVLRGDLKGTATSILYGRGSIQCYLLCTVFAVFLDLKF